MTFPQFFLKIFGSLRSPLRLCCFCSIFITFIQKKRKNFSLANTLFLIWPLPWVLSGYGLGWEDLTVDRSKCRNNLLRSLKSGELELAAAAADEKRAKRKEKERSTTPVNNTNDTVQFLCNFCNRHCRSRIDLFSHTKHCQLKDTA